ncbi:hypothetical protein ALO83_104175 [Pseudomonas cannabina pv. alisalensis]|uniref:Uncharacterized protein n=1 Tax=Pseudomonas cannabina TaxID=86840 RepID=A0A3M3SAH0_PSECA|nr:hypothetical protein ALO83_104175 [Pseudomonas cannabina pv. alisalensis]RMN77527.1 hypothetical protein ALQ52_104933 [Pseudomonas cannabina pv. alisalensis]RMN85110.1 hypothetical protein ALQ53_103894 [Pseudomonas cannabina]RMO05620.1 hypothetical protein ALQ51_102460 [Pseudomonas cannabina]
MLVNCPLLIAGLPGRFQWLAVSFLPKASISIFSPWITGPYNMHAAARLPGGWAGCMRSGTPHRRSSGC